MVSREKDLRSGLPVWAEYPCPRVPHTGLEGNLDTDVAIIGAGISGAMMAEALSGHGLDVALFDKRKPLAGSTSASTALLQYEIDEPLGRLSEKIGLKKAVAAWRRSRLGLESLAVKIRELNIECAYERRNSLYLAGSALDPVAMEEECRQRNAIGLPGRIVPKKELLNEYGIRGDGALMSMDNIACNPVQLAAGFLKAAIRRGAHIHAPVNIERLEHAKTHIRLTAQSGHSIKTRYVIFATGYEVPDYIPAKGHKIQSTWAISAKPAFALPKEFPFLWQASDPYNYGRTTMDGRMIFGGEDEAFSNAGKRDALLPAKTKILMKKLHRLFPGQAFELGHAWAGAFGASRTGLPAIGHMPRHRNCFAVMGYGGNGITFSRIAAEIVAADIFGYNDPDKELFSIR